MLFLGPFFSSSSINLSFFPDSVKFNLGSILSVGILTEPNLIFAYDNKDSLFSGVLSYLKFK